MMCDYDVIIVGGGPAGSSAAIHLARAGGRVLLAEQERFPRAKLCGEFISPECLAHFGRLGVLGAMEGEGGGVLRETIFYTSGGWRVAALGVLVEGARVRGVRLGVAGGGVREHTARVVVDATGRQRALARRVARAKESEGEGRRAPLVAFKAHLEGARGAEGVCEIYFYPGGYGGLSAVEGGAHNLCFIARAADVRARASDAARLMREVVMRNRRAAVTLDGARARDRWLGVALQSFGRHDPVPAEGLITVGDAASFIDPFTGSGMLMALESGELAARVVSDWLPDARRDRRNFDALARAYAAHYAARFDSRLRLCGLLRRAAFAPHALTEAAAVALNASARLRHKLARATRRAGARAP